MPAVPLLTHNNEPPHIVGEAEGLDIFLSPAGDPVIKARLGVETTVRREGALLVLKGERYRHRHGWVQGMRYLRMGPDSRPVAALNVTQIATDGKPPVNVASNVFVAQTHRRLGLARELLLIAQRDFPNLRADTSMSAAGAALIGQAPCVTPEPVRRPHRP